MLIIAIPKSAGTSLLVSIGRAQKLPWKHINHRWRLPKPKQMGLLLKYHSDMLEYSQKHIEIFADPEKFYSQHLPPTENNRKLLQNVKKVIQLRDPKEIIEAYWRADQVGLHQKRAEFAHCKTSEDWLNTAALNGLRSDLEFFKAGWLAETGPNTLHITYRDVVNDTKNTINKMQAFWELPITQEPIVLSARMYSRNKGRIF